MADLTRYPLNRERINPALKTEVVTKVARIFPIISADGKTTLRAESIEVDDSSFDASDLKQHQKARQTGVTWGATIKGKLVLEREGKVVQRQTVKLGTLPLMTDLGTFQVGGNDWFTPMAQLRLKPGAYTREKTNGEFETFIPMKGGAMSVWMDPAKGVLKLGYRSTNVDWYPIVRALGATDDEVRVALGGDKRATELLEVNSKAKDEKNIDKLYAALVEEKQNANLVKGRVIEDQSKVDNLDRSAKIAAIRAWMDGTKLDPFVTKRTLGSPIDKVGTELLLKSAGRILSVQRGDSEADDRDAPYFKTAHGVEDLIGERIERLTKMFTRDVNKRLSTAETISQALPNNLVDPATVGYFGGMRGIEGGLASTAEAANPLAILSEGSKLTLMGQGGIQSDHAITMGARLMRPSSVNFIDLVRTPEGASIGVVTHAASNTIREDKTLKSLFYPVKNGKVDVKNPVYLSTEDVASKTIGYPDEWDLKTGTTDDAHVRAIRDDQIIDVAPSEVEFLIPSGASAFDHTSNAALFLSNTHANRAMMAGKHLTQALPLIHREAPKVTLTDAKGNDVHERLARTFTIRAKVSGKVESVSPTEIVIAGVKHPLFDRYPMQAKVSLTHEPIVKVGDTVKEGQLIADSNYSKDGRLALGVHLRSMYAPWRNASNYEDALVISESAAKKLTSEHLHRLDLRTGDATTIDSKLYIAQFPTRINVTNLAKLDSDGIVKKGSKLIPGDVVITAVRKRRFEALDRSSKNLGEIHKSLLRPYVDAALVWDEDFPAEVIRVLKLSDHIEVHVRTEEPMQVGDKLSMSSAAKGTVSEIIPDDKMPRDAKGKHMEIIFNPHGVAGRINPSQTIEQASLKLAIDADHKLDHAAFDNRDHATEVLKALKKAGMTHAEILFDPVTGKDIERPVATGYNYVSKLDHSVRKKFSARGRDGYTVDEAPTQGKGKGGQSYDQLTTYALLGHNAHAILGESVGVRGTKNDDFWRAYQAGETPPPPKVPFVFEKFRNMLTASGIDTKQHGNTLHYMPLTDKRVLEMSNGAIENAKQVRAKDLAEEKGGLFDPKTTGGLFGQNWAHIKLGESIPHPLYEKVIRDVTSIKQAEYLGLIAHTLYYDPTDKKFYAEPGRGRVTGEEGFRSLLTFNVADRLADVSKRVMTAVGSDRNRLHRTSQYLRGLQTTKMNPFEAYMTSNIPVIPPKFRGIMEQAHGGIRVADANTLYRDIIMTRDVLKDAQDNKTLPESELGKARVSVYDALAATVGVGVPLTERRDNQELQGFVNIIKGKSNKEGLFQRQLARRRNDFTGRSTIEPDANLGVDEIGIPEEMAWKMYEPTVVRRLALGGWEPVDAAKQVKDRTLAARNALDHEMRERPVLYNRAPSLHRLSINAAVATITTGKELKISPMVLGPTGSDFDGDTMSVHVPITEDARRESFNLLPSRNLIYDRDKSLAFGPEKDVIAGVFALTRDGVASGLEFGSAAEAIDAFKNNKPASLRMNSTVRIKDISGTPTIGQLIFKSVVPDRFFAGVSFPIDRKKMEAILTKIATESPADFNRVSRMLTQSGFEAVARAGGFTATVDELSMDRTKVRSLLDKFEKDIQKGKTLDARRDIAWKGYGDTVKPMLRAALKEHLADHPIGYRDIMESGSSSKANYDQFQQIFMSPVLVNDVNDKLVPNVIKSSYGGGMRLSDYVMTLPGARAGIVARSLSTALPGFLAKELAGNVAPARITEIDCKTQNGIEILLDGSEPDIDIIDRHLLKDIPGTMFKRNDAITPNMLSVLRDRKIGSLWARSPLTCAAAQPPCQMCAGRGGDGKLWAVGSNIGINYGQAVTERSTQLTMRCTAGLIHSDRGIEAWSQYFDRHAKLGDFTEDIESGLSAVQDRSGCVTPTSASRHMPEDDVYFVATRTGSAFIVQGNHPIFVHPGTIHPKGHKNTLSQLTGDRTYRNSATTPRDFEAADPGMLDTVLARDLTKEHAIWVDYGPLLGPGTVIPTNWPAYLVGYYAGDGCQRIGNGNPTYDGKPVALCFATKRKTRYAAAVNARVLADIRKVTASYTEKFDSCDVYGPVLAQTMTSVVGSHFECRGPAQAPSNVKVLKFPVDRIDRTWLALLLDGLIDSDGHVATSSGATVAKITTTSIELALQIMAIGHRLGCRVSISLTDGCLSRKAEWSTAFNIEVRFPDGYATTSVKIQFAGGLRPAKRSRAPVRGFDTIAVSGIRKLTQWRGYVYDVKTPTCGYMAGSLHNHNSFHSGGTIGAGHSLTAGFQRLRELLSAPDVVRNQGTLAEHDGRISATRPAPQGGTYVSINGFEQYLAAGRKPSVRVGDIVSRGDPLSDGAYRPQDIAATKGLLPAQQYVVQQARSAYQMAGAVVRKPVLEVVVAATMRQMEVTDPGGEPDLVAGDILHENDFNSRVGRNRKLKGVPYVPGLSSKPLAMSTDLLERLNFQRLEDTLREIPARGGSSDLTGSRSPIPGFAYGAMFRPESQPFTIKKAERLASVLFEETEDYA